MSKQDWRSIVTITDPPFVSSLFGSTRWVWLWLPARLYVGYVWLTSSWGKVGNPAWVETGAA